MLIKRASTIPTGDELFNAAPKRAHADHARATERRRAANEPEPQAKIAGARDAKSKKKN